jgi:hypothetical protein
MLSVLARSILSSSVLLRLLERLSLRLAPRLVLSSSDAYCLRSVQVVPVAGRCARRANKDRPLRKHAAVPRRHRHDTRRRSTAARYYRGRKPKNRSSR